MARSFHYEGRFEKDGNVLNYSCVLYSMLLSLAYYFYSPESIMDIFRIINVITMLSSVFPIYLLGTRIIKDKKMTFAICIFSLFLPTMMDTAYCMQENLAYPLFLWVVYLTCKEMDEGKLLYVSKESLIIAVLSCVCYFTKTYMIFIPLVYCCIIMVDAIFKKKASVIKKLILFMAIYGALYLLGKYGILYINDGIVGSNHYSAQFLRIFPITGETILAAIGCITIYTVGLLFYLGVLPVILPLCNYKKMKENEQQFFAFIFLSMVVLIFEIVISIVLTEEGNVLVPKKILYRYFQILEIPLLMIFINRIRDWKFPKYISIVYGSVIGILAMYFWYIGNRQSHAIIDAPIYLLMENITKYVFPYFNLVVCMLAFAVVAIGAYLYLKKHWSSQLLLNTLVKSGMVCVGLFFIINLVQLPYYSNTIADGKKIQSDAIKIAKYLEEDKEHTDIYYVVTETDRYERAVYAYLDEQIKCISVDKIGDVQDKKAVFIMSAKSDFGDLFEELELDTEVVNVAHIE